MTDIADRQAVRRLAARYRGKRVGLLGGSFNPAHGGHRAIALEALKRFDLDAVWLMVSPGNPLKPSAGMASLAARMESTRRIADHPRLLATDVEKHLGTSRTADTILALQKVMPDTSLIWLMGADNLQQFDKWYAWQDIAHKLPIAVFDRPGYPVTALASRFASIMRRYRVGPERLVSSGKTGRQRLPRWCFVPMVRHPASATAIRASDETDWSER